MKITDSKKGALRLFILFAVFIWISLFSVLSVSETSEQFIWDDYQPSSYWQPVTLPPTIFQKSSEDVSSPNGIEISLDVPKIRGLLPSITRTGKKQTILYFPNSQGKVIPFVVEEKSNFSPVLAAKFPEISAYIGVAVGDPSQKIRFSVAPSGLEAVISSNSGSRRTNIEKIRGTTNYRIRSNYEGHHSHDKFSCFTETRASSSSFKSLLTAANTSSTIVKKSSFSNASTLSKYRLAVSASGQYTQYHGGTIEGALAGINATMTNVNAIFERDFGITLELIDNNDLIIYTDAATDPFEDNITYALNGELQSLLDSVIGTQNYDHGHLFSAIYSTMSGNAGVVGGFCSDEFKGSAWSDSQRPEGYDFTFLVAHEIGHQLGANHTYSFRSESTGKNVEPGSGTTVMSYAGITRADNVAIASDDYFHHTSIEQTLNYLQSQSCHIDTPNENNLPVIDEIDDVSIPILTPFILEGTATDVDQDDVLNYTWEQIDDGEVWYGNFGPSQQFGASFRSLPPSGAGIRYMPKLSSVLSGNLTLEDPDLSSSWETLSDVPRDLNFGFTVRDNAFGGGGVSLAKMTVSVVDSGGAFAITSPVGGQTYLAGSSHIVTWNLGGTNQAPINTDTVTITLSVDGGYTFPYTLGRNVENTGSHEVSLPDFVTAEARVRIEPDNNIFYTINDQNISLTRKDTILTADKTDYFVCSSDSVTASLTYQTSSDYNDTAILSASNLLSDLSVTFSPSSVTNNNTLIDATISATTSIVEGNYPISLHATSGSRSQSLGLNIQAYSAIFSPLTLSSPLDGSAIDMISTTLFWKGDPNAEQYQIEVSADQDFSEILQSVETSQTSQSIKDLTSNTTYYWRVIPKNRCGNGASVTGFSFTTPNNFTKAQDLPVVFAPEGEYNKFSTTIIEIEENQRIADINVLIDISMEDLGDLKITLTSPAGTVVELFNEYCEDNEDMQVIFDDQADALSCGPFGTSPNVSGRLKPQNDLLSRFNEQSTQGPWTLTVIDVMNLNRLNNTLHSFALEITTDAGVEYENYPPIAFNQLHPNTVNQETILSLEGSDPEGSPLSYRLTSSASGTLEKLAPRQLGNWTDSDTNCTGLTDLILIKDETIGISAGECNLTVLDVRDPSNISVLAKIEGDEGSFLTGVVSSDQTKLFIGGDRGIGLQIYDITEPTNIAFIGAYDTPGAAEGVVLSHDEKTAFVSDRSALEIIDINDPTNPLLLSTFETPGTVSDAALSPDGKTLYLVNRNFLASVDVSDPANPSLLGYVSTYENGGYSDSLVLSTNGKYAYIESTFYGLVIVDISVPGDPRIVGDLNLSVPNSHGGASKITLSPDGTTVYWAGDEVGLMTINVSDPLNPVLINTTPTLGEPFGVTVSDLGDLLYVSSRIRSDADGYRQSDGGLTIFNVEKELIKAGDAVTPIIFYISSIDGPDIDSFNFTVNDGSLDSNQAKVTLPIVDSIESNETWRYTVNDDGTIAIHGCSTACPSRVIIPDMINNATVTAIASYAFASSGITTLTLPFTLTHIGDYSFYDNTLLTVTIGANVAHIGVGAFAYNTLRVISFLGDRPRISLDALKLNRELISITYCDGTNGWPDNDISNGPINISPTIGCDAATAHSSALGAIGAAGVNGDASGLSLDDFDALIGLTGLNQVYLNQYLTFISNTSIQIASLEDIQYIISSVNETMSSCPTSAYLVSILGSRQYPDEISWDLIRNDNPDVPKLSGYAEKISDRDKGSAVRLSSLSCLEAGRYTLNMYDSFGDGWVDRDGTIDTFFTIWKFDGGDNIVREGLASGFYGKASVNLGDYSNVAPRADNQTIEVIRGVPKRISLLAIDEDLEFFSRRLVEEPSLGSLFSDLSFEAISNYFFTVKAYGLAVSDNDDIVYLAGGNSGLSILDTNNFEPGNLTLLSNLDTDGLTRAVTLSKDGRTLFLADGILGLKIVNVSDVLIPKLVSQLKTGGSVYDIAVSNDGNILYVAHLSGVSAVNISDISNPFVISTITTSGDAQAIRLSKDGALAYVADGYDGFHIVDISQPSSLKLLKSVDTPGEIHSLSLSPNNAALYLADGSFGFKVFDLKYPTEPKLIASLDNIGFVKSVEVSQDGFSVYLATRDRGYGGVPLVINVEDIQNPYLVSSSSSRSSSYVIPSKDGQRAFALEEYRVKLLNVGYVTPFADGNNVGESVIYLTDSDFSETDMFRFIANDGLLDSDAAQIDITILDDADGDRVPDRDDEFPDDAAESVDTDGDGIGNNSDLDDDGDSVPDLADAYPLIGLNGLIDTDSDGVPNNCPPSCISLGMISDNDDDGDGVSDENDLFPLDSAETVDSDLDGTGNNADPDDDNDGVLDASDDYPLNSIYTKDSDGDGMPDSWEIKYGLDPNDPSDANSDQDNDGVTALDEFLAGTIPSGSLDIDGNGQYDALTDGLLLLRGMFGLDGDALVTGTVASDAAFTMSVDIESRIATLGDLADIDGNGEIDALTDGLLTLRYLFGLEGDTLIAGVVASDATRTSAVDIEAHLKTLMPSL